MIQGFSVRGFRAFSNSGDVPLAPITCLVGRNSSGKSTLLNALLLLRQSIEQRPVGSRVPQLNLNGTLLNLGSYNDIVHGHNTNLPISFSFQTNSQTEVIRRRPYPNPAIVNLDVPRSPEYPHRFLSYRNYEMIKNKQDDHIKKVNIELFFLPEPPFGPALSRLDIEVVGIGKASFRRTTGERMEQHWRVYPKNIPRQSVEIYFPSWSFFPNILVRDEKVISLDKEQKKLVDDFVAYSQLAILDIHLFLSELKLLGPFRTPPSRRYSFTGIGAIDTGLSGERAVDLLITEKLVRPGNQYLNKAVSYWLRRLGLAHNVDVHDLAKKSNVFELNISGAGIAKTANFADVGFGISQVLPVLVQGLLVPRGSTYIVQQPELHLHPDAQAGLADFFIYLATQNVRSIVETHSEYLLLRLRRRLAEHAKPYIIGLPGEKTDAKRFNHESLSVVFVGEQDKKILVKKLEIGPAFQFDDLPNGFMNQAVNDRLALLKALSKS
ncbi:MAG: AAA family ATPase [Candidatus Latescibacterota bacterium]